MIRLNKTPIVRSSQLTLFRFVYRLKHIAFLLVMVKFGGTMKTHCQLVNFILRLSWATRFTVAMPAPLHPIRITPLMELEWDGDRKKKAIDREIRRLIQKEKDSEREREIWEESWDVRLRCLAGMPWQRRSIVRTTRFHFTRLAPITQLAHAERQFQLEWQSSREAWACATTGIRHSQHHRQTNSQH